MSDPYLSQTSCIDRLFNDYKAHKSLLVAFDFDDTVFDYHKKGYTYKAVTDLLLKCQDMGYFQIFQFVLLNHKVFYY